MQSSDRLRYKHMDWQPQNTLASPILATKASNHIIPKLVVSIQPLNIAVYNWLTGNYALNQQCILAWGWVLRLFFFHHFIAFNAGHDDMCNKGLWNTACSRSPLMIYSSAPLSYMYFSAWCSLCKKCKVLKKLARNHRRVVLDLLFGLNVGVQNYNTKCTVIQTTFTCYF